MDTEIPTVIGEVWRLLKGKPRIETLPVEEELLVIGDLHGDREALDMVLRGERVEEGLSAGGLRVVFLGDYVDRGPDSVGVLGRVCGLFNEYPDRVILLMGNHEGRAVHAYPCTWVGELERYSDPCGLRQVILDFMDCLQYGAVVPGYCFLVHGCVPSKLLTLDEIENLGLDDSSLIEMLWNDPSNAMKDMPSLRGVGFYVGRSTVNRFLEENKLRYIIRGHGNVLGGFERLGRTYTVHTVGERLTVLRIPLADAGGPGLYVERLSRG